MPSDLTRFVKAQESDFAVALSEITAGKKRSHWMWYILPQYQGLGFSDTARYYAIKSLQEAKDYLDHPLLGNRLKQITHQLLELDQTDPMKIFGDPDYMKLKSSMTLFSAASGDTDNLFESVLQKYYKGQRDEKTLSLLQATSF